MPEVIIRFLPLLDEGGPNDHYVSSREPLAPSPLRKLPIGAVNPLGWLRRMLEMQANGFSGRLSEISPYLDLKQSAWLYPEMESGSGWEEAPYWLKGQLDLGYLLQDKRIMEETKPWIEAALSSQREDGWFGPRSNLKAKDGKPDLWPNMIMLFVLQSHYEYASDPRVLALMERYFRWQLALPEEDFLHPATFWHFHRGGDNLLSVLWLYDRIGEPFLLDLAQKIHRNTADWSSGIADVHGVNFAQAFREPGTYFRLSGDPRDLQAAERNYAEMRAEFGQFPGGLYGADENVRKGFTDPRQGSETCAMVEMMFSCEHLLALTGDPKWADRVEDVAFNSLPASMTPDLKALRYLTAANQVLSDRGSKYPGIANTGPMFVMDPTDHRCCQHNVAQGWPYFVEHLWMAAGANGLAATMYAPCEVSAKVGNGTPITITETTDYPFREVVRVTVQTQEPVRFPLSLRIPAWSVGPPEIRINEEQCHSEGSGPGFLAIERTWYEGDELEVRFPTRVRTTSWQAQKGAVSVCRGPLCFSLSIAEKCIRSGGSDSWHAFEIHPESPWNYGLDPEQEFEVVEKGMPADGRPFSASNAPIELRAKARRIPNWKADHLGLVGELQQSPAKVETPEEPIALVPMGAARLRVTVFPTVTTSDAGALWSEPPEPSVAIPASSSYVNPSDSLDALSDNLVPQSSSDESIPRFTWWDHVGTLEWVQYDFGEDRFIGKVEVYWCDDGSRGLCRPPESWRVLYWDDGAWADAKPRGEYGIEANQFNEVELMPFRSSKLRIEARLRDGFSAGILEWRFR